MKQNSEAHPLAIERNSHHSVIVVLGYSALIATAELLSLTSSTLTGAIGHALLLPLLLSHYVIQQQAPYRRFLAALALLPLLRLLSLIMPIQQLPAVFWPAMAGIPLLIAILLTARLLNLTWHRLGLNSGPVLEQGLIALSGIPLSYVAYWFFNPELLASTADGRDMLLSSLNLFLFGALIEELIFRGLLQQTALEAYGVVGLLPVNLLFGVMYLGTGSVSYAIFMVLAGSFFSWCVLHSRSLWGVIVAHSLLNIALLLAWPMWG